MFLKIVLTLIMVYFIADSFMIEQSATSAIHQILASMSMIKAILVGIILSVVHFRKRE